MGKHWCEKCNEYHEIPHIVIKTREEYPGLTQEEIDALEKWLSETILELFQDVQVDTESLNNILKALESTWLKDYYKYKIKH